MLGNRVIPDPLERRRLLKIRAELGHVVEHTLDILSIKTYRRWLREERNGRQARKVGRPRLTRSLRELIVKLAKENLGWGARRILGELKKLAVKTSRSSVRRVLVDEDILPDPGRHAPKGVQTPWKKFIAIHMNVMVACDFFCKTIWTPMGRKQQARNVRMWAQEEGIDIRFLIHDRDSKFSEAFDEFFRRPYGGIVLTPYQAPIANCFIESWIGSLKRECLNAFFCFILRQLDHIVQTYASYHNQYRPHQGLDNRPLGVPEYPSRQAREIDAGEIRCKEWFGGLLKHYYRNAA